jgi:2-iminobutanoate/2-iminopropanoate deaminase
VKQIIRTDKAPQAIGPYSAGVKFGDIIFISGQIGIDPQTAEVVDGGIDAETRQVLRNLGSVLEAAGSSLSEVVKTTVFLKDMGDFAQMNAIYAEFFTEDFPARSTIAVAGLPAGVSVEIEAIAVKGES